MYKSDTTRAMPQVHKNTVAVQDHMTTRERHTKARPQGHKLMRVSSRGIMVLSL